MFFFFVTCVNCFNGVLVVAHIICAAVSQRLCASGLVAPHVRVPLCPLFFRKLLDFSPLFIISTVQVVFSFFSTIATKSEMIYVTPNRFCKPQGLLR